jgi:hypothetical protein
MRITHAHSKRAFACILAANALWDFACGLSILTQSEPLGRVHTGLWLSKSERDSPAASHLMAYLVFCWGFLRLLGALGAARGVALFSYLLECVVCTMSEDWLCQPLRRLWLCGHGGQEWGTELYTTRGVIESDQDKNTNTFKFSWHR